MLQEKIREYANNMNVKFALKKYIKLNQLEDEIKRNVKKELSGSNSIQFTSQDLRYFVIQLEKTHKAVNKILNFSQFQKRFEKYNEISGKELLEQTYTICEYIACAKELQRIYSTVNYHAMLLLLIETQKEQKKKENDEIFTNEIAKLLKTI